MKLAVLTSGGDAPGMNAAIRAVVRGAVMRDMTVLGVIDGFQGLMEGRFRSLGDRDVGGIMQQGGTVLRSARASEFRTDDGQRRALSALRAEAVEALVVIGGNGSQQGSFALSRRGVPVVGIGSTIDNDLYGCEPSLGVDTALNIVLEALDRIRNTASSHSRVFLVEVMGRGSGYLALQAGVAGGAEAIAIPETDAEPAVLAAELLDAYRAKGHAVAVIAEGWRDGAAGLMRYFEARTKAGDDLPKVRLSILGHVQRGGCPSYVDRMAGTRMGLATVACLAHGQHGVLVGLQHGQIVTTPLEVVTSRSKDVDPESVISARTLLS